MSKQRSIGSKPALFPLVDAMRLPLARTLDTDKPIPPADFEMSAHRFWVSKIPSMESSWMGRRKHDASVEGACPR